MRFFLQLLVLSLALPLVVYGFSARKNFNGAEENDIPDEFWDYVTVRPKAHMFYWLYKTTHSSGYKDRPVIMWLEGGPGGSSTGWGNFGAIGPLNVKQKPRETTWLQTANLLFIDSPVGSGFSYVEDDSTLTTNMDGISADLLTLMKDFMEKHPDFEEIPFYIIGYSYGGKTAAAVADTLYTAIQSGEIKMNLKGFAMGNSWTSPVDSTNSWGPFLYATSFLDDAGLMAVQDAARRVEELVHKGKFVEATGAWSKLQKTTIKQSHGVSFYNILKWLNKKNSQTLKFHPEDENTVGNMTLNYLMPPPNGAMDALMNGPIKRKLKIIPKKVEWGVQQWKVFKAQRGDFMRDNVATVNKLINTTPLKAVVYQGQLDLICDTLGAAAWFNRLDIAEDFHSKAERELKSCKGHSKACYYQKVYKNVQFYWVLEAGHAVPIDNAWGALDMVNNIIKEDAP